MMLLMLPVISFAFGIACCAGIIALPSDGVTDARTACRSSRKDHSHSITNLRHGCSGDVVPCEIPTPSDGRRSPIAKPSFRGSCMFHSQIKQTCSLSGGTWYTSTSLHLQSLEDKDGKEIVSPSQNIQFPLFATNEISYRVKDASLGFTWYPQLGVKRQGLILFRYKKCLWYSDETKPCAACNMEPWSRGGLDCPGEPRNNPVLERSSDLYCEFNCG